MGEFNFLELGALIAMKFIPFLLALSIHEFAHAWVAKLLGDDTAERMGRLNINPLTHSDPVGTWLLPLSLLLFQPGWMFGWAKPVPVNTLNLKRPERDMFWIALAGPVSNFLLAIVSTIILAVLIGRGPDGTSGYSMQMFVVNFIALNITLGIFNLIPIHPLDGGKVAAPFLPRNWLMWMDHHPRELSIMLFFLIFFSGSVIAIPVNFLAGHLIDFAQAVGGRLA